MYKSVYVVLDVVKIDQCFCSKTFVTTTLNQIIITLKFNFNSQSPRPQNNYHEYFRLNNE